jgi:hypothetical protein
VRFIGTSSVILQKPKVNKNESEPGSPISHEVDMLYQAYGRRKGMGPRFSDTTESSSQNIYTNFEAERIHETFHSANFHSMKKLPVSIAPDQVLASSTNWTKGNLKESKR